MTNRVIMSDRIMSARMLQSKGAANAYLRAKKLEYTKALSADLLKSMSSLSAYTMCAYLTDYSAHRTSEPST